MEGIPGETGMVIVAEIETTVGNIDECRVGCHVIRLMIDQFKQISRSDTVFDQSPHSATGADPIRPEGCSVITRGGINAIKMIGRCNVLKQACLNLNIFRQPFECTYQIPLNRIFFFDP